MEKKVCSHTRALWVAVPLFAAVAAVVILGAALDPVRANPAESFALPRVRAVASSTENPSLGPGNAIDGIFTTRWSSTFTDPQWIYVDIGQYATIELVTITWETAHALAYEIQVSNDACSWTTMYYTATADGGVDTISVSGAGRYVRVYGIKRAIDAFGYSIYEIELFSTTPDPTPTPPAPPATNLALNKPASASSTQDGHTASNAVDGNPETRWSSVFSDPQWISVDLGSTYTIGRVVLAWETAHARAYALEISDDGVNWTRAYTRTCGSGGVEEIVLNVSGRYLRVYGYARATGWGYSLLELEVYEYLGGPVSPPTPPCSSPTVLSEGEGSYIQVPCCDISYTIPMYPKYVTGTASSPIPSNSWWQSIAVDSLSDGVIPLPLKYSFTRNGLEIYNPIGRLFSTDTVRVPDIPGLRLIARNIDPATMEARVSGYGDWSVQTILSDDDTPKMQTTMVQGSPYLYAQFSEPDMVELSATDIFLGQILDRNGNEILTQTGSCHTDDHILVVMTTTVSVFGGQKTITPSYGIFCPPGTLFRRIGDKLEIELGGGEDYMSIAAMPTNAPPHDHLADLYQHAYAFVTNTHVSWAYTPMSATVTTIFTASTEVKRSGFSSSTLLALFPHQWKFTPSSLTQLSYDTIRGIAKVHEGNTFVVENRFWGITPSFGEPIWSPTYSRSELIAHLNAFSESVTPSPMVNDTYWQGKKLHLLSMGALIADQIGETAMRDHFVQLLRDILTDWYTYTPGEPRHYFTYHAEWGTLVGRDASYGSDSGLSDHHFHYGYYVFASSVLAMYDQDFVDDYGGMVEHLIRDYANPSRDDPLYPHLRTFDPYFGHSWAGGYADNPSGNNQESSSEAMSSWAGVFLWGVATGNDTYRDLGAWGYTVERTAIDEYWFDCDQDIWYGTAYNHGTVGILWGDAYHYGTWFSGEAEHIYGIQWLPWTPASTYLGYRPECAGRIYADFLDDNGGPPVTWQHIISPFQSLNDAQTVVAQWDSNAIPIEERFNVYWFIHNMMSMGQPSPDRWAANWPSYQVYEKAESECEFTAVIWNPISTTQTVDFYDASSFVRSVSALPKSTTVDDLCPVLALAIAKRADPDPVQPGAPLTYTISITNTGDVALTATITDVLPAQVTPSGSLTWTTSITAPGGLWTEQFTVTVNMGYAGVLTNVVQVTTAEGVTGTYTHTITVTETNAAPVLGLIGDKWVNEGETLTFTAVATDTDVPANALSFSLDAGAPSGANIDGATGEFTWTPTEAQGPGTYTVTVRVTDDGVPALDDAETITITVNEVFCVNLPLVMRNHQSTAHYTRAALDGEGRIESVSDNRFYPLLFARSNQRLSNKEESK